MQEPRAAGQARDAPLSAGVSPGLCHLSLGMFCPTSPRPLRYSSLGTGGQSSGSCREGRIWWILGSSRCHQDAGFEPSGVTDSLCMVLVRGARPRDGKAAAALPDFLRCREGGIAPAESPALPSPTNLHPRPPRGWDTWRCLCRAASPAACAGPWRGTNLIRGELAAPAEPRASPAPLQRQQRARNAAPHPQEREAELEISPAS